MSESHSGQFASEKPRAILGDLFIHRASIYWPRPGGHADDFGHGSAMIYLKGAGLLGPADRDIPNRGFARRFSAGSFIHEITHLRKGELPRISAWRGTFAAASSMLMPSFFYENHI